MLLKSYQTGHLQMLKLAIFKTEYFLDRLPTDLRSKLQH